MAVVLITPDAQEQFNSLPKTIRARMEKLLLRLQQWPTVSGAKPLRGTLTGRYRMRSGDYRLQFRASTYDLRKSVRGPNVVLVEKIGHRDRFYEE